ncbi:MAG: hypothetical protein JWN51_3512 [Phycisphaerales bacterium]|jgi:hypothetical protein|nr:hypothetical protein [Phycisphaerales bacterium]
MFYRTSTLISLTLLCYLLKVGVFGGGFDYCSGTKERPKGYNILVRLDTTGLWFSRSRTRYFYMTHKIPLGSLIGFAAVLPAVWLVRQTLPARREGFCAKCGYDLRATPDRCPECGAVPTHMPCPPVPRAHNAPSEEA